MEVCRKKILEKRNSKKKILRKKLKKKYFIANILKSLWLGRNTYINTIIDVLKKASFQRHILIQFRKTELCHTKTGLKIFDAVIPKEDLAGTSPSDPSFDMALPIELYSILFRDYEFDYVSAVIH